MPPIPHIRVAVFDIGETLVDETRAWSVQAEAAGVTPLTLFAGLGALIERGEDHRRVWDLLGVKRPAQPDEILADDLYADALPCLRALAAAGIRLGLAGNQPAQAESALGRLGLPVSFIASSARWGVEKPSPEFFARVLSEAGAAPEQIAYVGDRLDNDVLPARRAGMFAVFVRRGPWGHLHAHRPEVDAASAIIDSLAELPALIAGPRVAGG
ncbi:MAG TPA: HAD family hydrolase [Solirubrobacteraceae bacterium]|nr:HAD family hydrolase [Solirubrobacteraceae bacterium]